MLVCDDWKIRIEKLISVGGIAIQPEFKGIVCIFMARLSQTTKFKHIVIIWRWPQFSRDFVAEDLSL
ncbi:MAG: hypothetical protein ACLTSD_09000 [Eubacterium sp.]